MATNRRAVQRVATLNGSWAPKAVRTATRRCVVVADKRISAALCSTDLVRSQEFYEKKVGLKLSGQTTKNHLLFDCGNGTTLLVYGRPTPSKADHTQVRLWSSDVEADVRELLARGVVFEDYDLETLKTIDHVATTAGIGKSAWFKDPDGNTLALFQPE
jgi:catechol 2,3-dioxygenase-like lactoylglutathione lyase family enzyme